MGGLRALVGVRTKETTAEVGALETEIRGFRNVEAYIYEMYVAFNLFGLMLAMYKDRAVRKKT